MWIFGFSSVQLSHSVVSDSLWPHGLPHARPPCPLPTPGVYSNSCPLSWWRHPTISFSVVPFSSFLQSFLASGSFPMSQLFAWGGQSSGGSALASALPMNVQDWFSLGLIGLISLLSKGLSRVSSNTSLKASIFWCSTIFMGQPLHPYITIGKKNIALTIWLVVCKVMSLLFNMLSRIFIDFFPKEHASFNFMAAVTIHSDFGAPENKLFQCFYCFPTCHEVIGPDAMTF